MKKTGRNSLITAFLALTFGLLHAQDVRFYMTVSKNPVAMGDNFQLRLTMENARGNVDPIDFSSFQLIAGPNQATSQQFINGVVTSSFTLSYFLRPTKTGKFTIGPARANINGKSYATESITIEVVGSGAGAQQSQGGGSASAQAPRTDQNVQVVIELSKRQAYIGEQIIARYVLLTRYRNLEATDTRFPSIPGFWSEDLKNEQSTWQQDLEMINGVAYRKAILRTQILFPQRTGNLKLEPLEFTCRVDRSLFNPGTEIKVKSNSPSIEVVPYPVASPKSFEGAVGNLTFNVELSRTNVKANEAIDLKININGNGNLTLIGAPKIPFPDDFEVYDPEIKDRVNVSAGGVNGSRTFQYLIIPRYPATYVIPEVVFSYFNPAKASFETFTKGPFTIEVSGEAGGASGNVGRARKSVNQSAQDIRYIYTDDKNLEPKNNYFFGSIAYYGTLTSPFLALLLFVLVRRKNDERSQNTSMIKKRRASKMAKSRLKAARKALDQKDEKLFYAEVFKALYGYFSDKLNIAQSEMTRPRIAAALAQSHAKPELVSRVNKALDTCEMARFAPITDRQAEAFYTEVAELITQLENDLK